MILNERERDAAYHLYSMLASVLQTHQIIMEEARCEYGIPSAVEKALMALQEEVLHYEGLITGKLSVHAQDWQIILDGSFLVDLRISRGWSQADLAKSLKIPVQQLQTWERASYDTVPLEIGHQVAALLGCTHKFMRMRWQVAAPQR